MSNAAFMTLAFFSGVAVAYLSIMIALAIVIGIGKSEETAK